MVNYYNIITRNLRLTAADRGNLLIPVLGSGFLTSCMYFNGMEPGMGPIEVQRNAVLPNNRWFMADELDVPIKFCPLQAAIKIKLSCN